ncbi:low-density lipoprotein receptor-related protein 2-like [Trichogramma pretiosum]|uniref:low-density lipoprotein receptor-related protein 2-like n=1 Tax=Trichogramma pretiosum TaxID=7493 RepID=UPI0006C96E68|nr:low-density lipoprotein receptor-related protein 2-like [Trichogramma pretiosum]
MIISWCFVLFLHLVKANDKAKYDHELDFLVTRRNEIWLLKNSGEKYKYKIDESSIIADVDYHWPKGLLFWIDYNRREINSQSLDPNKTSTRFIFKQKRNWQPIALAIDFVNDKLYVVDTMGLKIDIFELDGKYYNIISSCNVVRPSDIELDPRERIMFILDGHIIIRASLDGTFSTNIIESQLSILHGIFVDTNSKKLYWISKNSSVVIASDYSGARLATLHLNNNTSADIGWTKFAVYNESIFMASQFMVYNFNCGNSCNARRQNVYPMNPPPVVKAIKSTIQKPTFTSCQKKNDCQHMCISTLSNENVHRCACNIGWKAKKNLKDCEYVDDFLMYSDSRILKSRLTDPCIFCEAYLPISLENHMKLIDFDLDKVENYLYFIAISALKYDTIYKVRINGTDAEAEEKFSIGMYENYNSLSIDWISRNLYVTDSWNGTIKVFSMRDKGKKLTVLKNLTNPECIIVHPKQSFVYFLQSFDESKNKFLSRVNTDGSNLIAFRHISFSEYSGFTLDLHENRIYWYDWNLPNIRHSDLDLNNILDTQLMTLTKYIRSIFVDKLWIYLVYFRSEGIWRLDKSEKSKPTLLLKDISNKIMKIKIFRSIISTEKHACEVNSGVCSEFCFSLPKTNDTVKNYVCRDSDML